MPATSSKQKKFMDAAAHNKAFAQQSGVPQSVAKDFSSASKGMKFGKGPKSRADLQRINKPETRQGKMELFKKGGDTMATKMNPGFMAMMAKKKGAAPSAMGKPTMKKGMDMAKDGMKKMMGGGMAYAKGGSASARADGIASKGKTKGKMLKSGGKAC
jgi:hypothetical protein